MSPSGYLPFERHAAHLFFQLVSRRYERGSILITLNRLVSECAEVFGDAVVATAILDRLLHHSHVLNDHRRELPAAREASRRRAGRIRHVAGEGGVVSVRGCRDTGRSALLSFADGVPPVRAPDGSSGFLSPSQGVSFRVAKGSVADLA